MNKFLKLVKPIAAVAVLMAAGAVQATPTYGDIANPGVHYGAGNVNGNFTIDSNNGIEVALRAKNYGGALIDGVNGVYNTSSGLSAIGLALGKNRAVWNFDFSVNTGAKALGDYVFMLGMDNDPTTATSYDYIDVSLYSDNHIVGNSLQNSQNIIFYPTGQLGPFNINSSGLYNFSLTAYDKNDLATALASTEIQVSVPEPESMALMGLGLLGLAAVRRRRSK